MASKRSNHKHNIKRCASQPSIHQFLKKSKPNKKTPIINTTTISPYISLYQNIKQCPMCYKNISGLSVSNRDIHTNMCLDLSSVSMPKYVKKSLRFNNAWNRKKKKLNRYYSTDINGYNSNSLSKQQVYNKYKVLNDSNIVIDGFSGHLSFAPHNAIYFLTHFHSDHYKGLSDKFRKSHIYCSAITARLIQSQIGVDPSVIRPLELNKQFEIEGSVPRTFVTLLDANHCPGAVMCLFEMCIPDERRWHLHIGDARCEFETDSFFYRHNYGILSEYFGKIDKLYLDTTYVDSKMYLPRQSDAIQYIVNKCKMYLNHDNDDLVILIGTYSIGKERILRQVAKECNKKIFITKHKQSIFDAVYCDDVDPFYTMDETATNIHVVPMRDISFSTMWQYKKNANTKVIGFKPSGWASDGYRHMKKDKKHVIYPRYNDKTSTSSTIYEVPYSEHSSFMELCKFVKNINAKEIIPTVNNETVFKVERQIKCLEEYKDSIEYEYHQLIEGDGFKQQTLESCGFVFDDTF